MVFNFPTIIMNTSSPQPDPWKGKLIGSMVNCSRYSQELLATLAAQFMPRIEVPPDWQRMNLEALAGSTRAQFETLNPKVPCPFDIIAAEALRRAERLLLVASGKTHEALTPVEVDHSEDEELAARFNKDHPGTGPVPFAQIAEWALRRRHKDWSHAPDEEGRKRVLDGFLKLHPGAQGKVTYRRNVPELIKALRNYWIDYAAEIGKERSEEGGRESKRRQKGIHAEARKEGKLEAEEVRKLDATIDRRGGKSATPRKKSARK